MKRERDLQTIVSERHVYASYRKEVSLMIRLLQLLVIKMKSIADYADTDLDDHNNISLIISQNQQSASSLMNVQHSSCQPPVPLQPVGDNPAFVLNNCTVSVSMCNICTINEWFPFSLVAGKCPYQDVQTPGQGQGKTPLSTPCT